MWLVSLGIDFYLHILTVIVLATIVARVCFLTGADRSLACVLGALSGLAVGLLKEAYDSKTTGAASAKDMLGNVIGAALFFVTFI